MAWHDVTAYGAVGNGLVGDEAPAMQAALDAASPGETVYVPPGLYLVQSALEIGAGVRLVVEGTIRRNANSMNLLMNAHRSAPGYTGDTDIEVVGGVWDMNRAAFPTSGNGMIFGHCERVSILGARIMSVHHDHHIELNAVRGARVSGCEFSDFSRTRAAEAIQLDLMKGVGQYPYGNVYDNTPCDDVLIECCRFRGGLSRGIGSHSSTSGVYHTAIRIIGNHFEDCADEAILGLQWRDVVVTGNTARSSGAAVWTACDNVVVGINVGLMDTVTPPSGGSLPPGNADGDVLTWRDGVWQPEPAQTTELGAFAHSVVGYTAAGATSEAMVSRRVYAKRITLDTPALIASIGAYVQSDGLDHVGGLAVALYEDVSGTPGKLLDASSMSSVDLLLQSASGAQPTTPRWFDRALAYDAAAGSYWIAVMDPGTGSNRNVIRKDTGGSDRSYTSGGSWFADWGRYTPTTTTDRYSIRAKLVA
jgi:hypothetical protein